MNKRKFNRFILKEEYAGVKVNTFEELAQVIEE